MITSFQRPNTGLHNFVHKTIKPYLKLNTLSTISNFKYNIKQLVWNLVKKRAHYKQWNIIQK